MEINFKGKRALVTGAGKGIGRQCVKRLVECGAHVIALSRTQGDLDTLKQECPKIDTIFVDVQNDKKTRSKISPFLPVDLLVNNAGISPVNNFLNTSIEEFDGTIAINLRGYFNIAQFIAKSMVERKYPGAVVNVSSILSDSVWENYAAYCISKGGVDQLTRVMAVELGKYGIRTNSVHPTVVLTPLVQGHFANNTSDTFYARDGTLLRCPLGKYADMDDVVNQIIFLLSDHSKMVNGVMVKVDGGLTVRS